MKESRPRGRPRSFDRDGLLDAATSQFWLKGFEATSVTDLTEAAGCSAPTLYALFGSKEALYDQVVTRYAERSLGSRTDLLTREPADRDGLRKMLMATIEATTSKDHPPGCLILNGGLAEPQSPAAGAVARLRGAMLDVLRNFLDRAREEGHLGPCDTRALARFYLAVAQGLAAQAVDGAGREDLLPLVPVVMATWPTPDR